MKKIGIGPQFWPNPESRMGFTLIETLIAISIMAIGILAFMDVLVMGLGGLNSARHKIEAINVAQQIIEERIMKAEYDSSVLDTSSSPSGTVDSYNWDYIVDYVDSDYNSSVSDVGYKKVVVTVSRTGIPDQKLVTIRTDFE